MSDEDDPLVNGISKGIAETVSDIYQDGLKPAVKEVGKGLETVANIGVETLQNKAI